ncbi:MAG TPA: hypothetical protein VEA41_06955 [Salinarimonas sp.]|nr:hypothetical protein [Salinarimonas sp.]
MPTRPKTVQGCAAECIERLGVDLATHERVRACVQEQMPGARVAPIMITTLLKKMRRGGPVAKIRPGHHVIIAGREYRSVAQAARALGYSKQGVIKRLRNPAFPDWAYAADVAQDGAGKS